MTHEPTACEFVARGNEFRRVMTPAEIRATRSGDEWKHERVIEMRWNRLVCYPSQLLHSIFLQPGDFGETLETTRLTMNLFLDVIDQNQEDSPQMPPVSA